MLCECDGMELPVNRETVQGICRTASSMAAFTGQVMFETGIKCDGTAHFRDIQSLEMSLCNNGSMATSSEHISARVTMP